MKFGLLILFLISVVAAQDVEKLSAQAEKLESQASHYLRLAENKIKLAEAYELQAKEQTTSSEKLKKQALTERKRAQTIITKAQGRLQQAIQIRNEILAVTEDARAETLRIGSWNIQNFGESKMSKSINFRGKQRPLPEVIAEILIESKFAVIAIQEIEGDNLDALQTVVDHMNKDREIYQMTYPEKMGQSANKAEYLPIIYNTELVRIGFRGNLKDVEMQRSPHYAYFSLRPDKFVTPQNNKSLFDFVLVSVHLAPKASGVDDVPRQKDFFLLSKVMRDLKKKFSENDIIIAGDFNCDPTTKRGIDRSLWDKIAESVAKVHKLKVEQNGKDVPATKSMTQGDRINDNIIWDEQAEEDWSGRKNVYDFMSLYFANDPEAAQQISDHMPVFAEFYSSRDSD